MKSCQLREEVEEIARENEKLAEYMRSWQKGEYDKLPGEEICRKLASEGI
jgi:hypothetical protein